MITAFFISFILSYIFIELFLKKLRTKIGQPILQYTSEDHQKKIGTPTMGGLPFLVTIIIVSFIFYLYGSINILFLAIITLIIIGYGVLGFIDDYLKVKKKDNEKGLSPWQKIIFQLIISIIIII